ncbi:MAG: hypothetical protein GF375_00830 [Candidatus Omnitrophica bacterium]|nr:hypothetical protein [Candidatus Omnitrophota bacterium]
MGTEDVRILPAQGVFVPRITHDSRGNRIIPLLGAGQSYDTGVFMVRGYNKLDIIARSNVNADIFVYMGPDPSELAAMTPGDNREKAQLPYAELAIPNGDFPPEQYSVQVSGDFARVIFRNNTAEAQTVWDFQVNLKPIGEGQCFREYDDEGVNPLGVPKYRYLTMTPDYRLRVDAIIGGGGGGTVTVVGQLAEAVVLANDGALGAGAETAVAARPTGTSPGAGLQPIGKIGITASINTSGNGYFLIEYCSNYNTPNWRVYEEIPLVFPQKIHKTLIPTAPGYRFRFHANSAVAGLDAVVVLWPNT